MITTATDERTITVLKATACERIYIDEHSEPHCAFCPGVRSALVGDVIHHELWCATILSRLVLQDLGISLSLYMVTYEVQIENAVKYRSPRARSENWRTMETYASGYDTTELTKLYAMYRNVKIKKVRIL